jgi:L-ascorbate metabolism protein UlaG (beta-lactamase superfamily)
MLAATHRGSVLPRALLAIALAACSPPAPLSIRFIGNAAFELTDGRTTLLIDFPYESGVGGFMTYHSSAVRAQGRVLALFTHRHSDHFDRDALLARGWPAYGPAEVLALLPPDRVFSRSDSVAIGEFRVARIPERHVRHADVETIAFLITWRGRRIYHSGDTVDPADLQAMPELDVALVQENLLCWMAQQRGARVPAREVIAFHFFAGESRGCVGARALEQGESVEVPPAR